MSCLEVQPLLTGYQRSEARGALSAALWLSSRPPGRYSMRDFIFPKTET